MNAREERAFSFDELLQQEERSPVRHEFIGGQLHAMAGGTPRHADITTNIAASVQTDQRVRVSESSANWYYPDFLIKCPPHTFHSRDQNSLLNPRAIFEVLSPETERFDRTGKFDEYKKIEELSDYVLVDTQSVRVEHFRRLEDGTWAQSVYTLLSQELRLNNFGISMPLSEIYEDVEVGEQSILPLETVVG